MALPITQEAIDFAELDPHENDVLFVFDPLFPSGYVKKVIRRISNNGRTVYFTDNTSIDVSTILSKFYQLFPALRAKVIFDYKVKGVISFEGVGTVIDHAVRNNLPMVHVVYIHSWVWDDTVHYDVRDDWIEHREIKDIV